MHTHEKTFLSNQGKTTLSTGVLATRAQASVVVDCGQTKILVAVVISPQAQLNIDFLPLAVKYQERFYAAGRIPGGFTRREGKSTDRETIISRLIDRSLRPLFPQGFAQEVQIIVTLLSHDANVLPETLAIIGCSAALQLAAVPLINNVSATRVSMINGHFVNEPTNEQQTNSDLDLIVVGNAHSIFMLDCSANEINKESLTEAIVFGKDNLAQSLAAIEDFVQDHKKSERPAIKYHLSKQADLTSKIIEQYKQDISEHCQDFSQDRINDIAAKIYMQIDHENISEEDVRYHVKKLVKDSIVDNILSGKARIDGRHTKQIRDISIHNSFLPSAHGSSLFTRGKTQLLSVVTLGSNNSAQIIEGLSSNSNRFMLHYNFPAFSAGEIGIYSVPKRREIGHAELAIKAIKPVLPKEDYPFVIRVVSDVLSADGSTSMATICSTSLAMMDGGVPITKHVAGIAMGLLKKEKKFAVLTDISHQEDMLGDMDFKIAGTHKGITALQMDLKSTDGIDPALIYIVLSQGRDAISEILAKMDESVSAPRKNTSANTPRIKEIKIDGSRIKDLIGKKGAVIKSIIEETGADINICNDTNIVQIFAGTQDSLDLALKRINDIISPVQLGNVYDGVVVKILEKGSFVNLKPNVDGYLPASYGDVREGDFVKVEVQNIDDKNRIRLKLL